MGWGASTHGLFVLEEEKINNVKVGYTKLNLEKMRKDDTVVFERQYEECKVFIPSGINNMVANEDLLIITGESRVILFDGNKWFNLFDTEKTEKQLRATGTFYDPREK